MASEIGRRRFAAIEGYRGIAALAVAAGHSVVFFGNCAPWHSYLAVDFFFILSGAVLAHSYDARLMDGRLSPWEFIKLRALRLYPVIVMATLAAIVVHSLIFAAHSGATPFRNYGSLLWSGLLTTLLVPQFWMGEFYPINQPFWSLLFELIVNVLFVTTFRLLWGWRLIAIIALSYLAMIILTPSSKSFVQGFHTEYAALALSRATYGFFVGVFISRSTRGKPLNANAPFLAGALVLAVIFWAPALTAVHFDLAATLLLLPPVAWLAVKIEPVGILESSARFMGKVSYPLYAFNLPFVLFAAACVKVAGLRTVAAGWLIGVAFLLASVLTAYAVDRLADEPLRARLKKIL
ncbi:acyltransferase family protein [Sphingomonas pruni]|uniref:acyltransferase family protein n=1 Tax=Sphingomonas pruni TaxID=40683 RepID=UPI000AA4B41E|nr:acyltransferase [Sphingomonas pruni]